MTISYCFIHVLRLQCIKNFNNNFCHSIEFVEHHKCSILMNSVKYSDCKVESRKENSRKYLAWSSEMIEQNIDGLQRSLTLMWQQKFCQRKEIKT